LTRDASEEDTVIITVPSITFIQIRLLIIKFWIHIMDRKSFICCMFQLLFYVTIHSLVFNIY
jgi:hypothetical protein